MLPHGYLENIRNLYFSLNLLPTSNLLPTIYNVYSVSATRQSHVTSCQIRNIFARHVRKVKGRYGNNGEYFNFSLIKKIFYIITQKVNLPIKVRIN